jgi:hypothetical protein
MIFLIGLVLFAAPLATAPGKANLIEGINTLLSNMARLTFLELGILTTLVVCPCTQFGIG